MSTSILIVEDDLTFSLMLKTWLGKKGFQVDTVSNITRARRELTDNHYDVILSDLRLPDEDGIALLNWMHKQGIGCPLIIMTGYADIQTAVQAMKCGAFDYISKPVQPDELLKKIEEALRNGTSAVSSPTHLQPSPLQTPSIQTPRTTWKEKVKPHTNSTIMSAWSLRHRCPCSSTEPAERAKST